MSVSQKKGMHWERVKAELAVRGWPLARIARHLGFANLHTPGDVKRQKWPAMQEFIGEILGVPPQDIWPERYDAQGHYKGRATRSRYTRKSGTNRTKTP